MKHVTVLDFNMSDSLETATFTVSLAEGFFYRELDYIETLGLVHAVRLARAQGKRYISLSGSNVKTVCGNDILEISWDQ